ncbi:hypothetical protein H8K38_13250 [Undibacterium sp. FT79W]|nr:hypothetical protein [Undibacterium sp. FT79W]MBC3878774.1 hypothetical protein [Undibacterium sp. FT79W]
MGRFKQGSTWAGFGVLASVAVSFLPPEFVVVAQCISAASAAIAGVLNS